MIIRTCAVVAVALLAVAGCSGPGHADGEGGGEHASKGAYSAEAKDCFVQVIKAVNLTLETAEGAPTGGDAEAEFADFGVKAQGTPTWDIYKEYSDMGARELAQGKRATATDALAAYAPSIKLECVRAYG
ncbi:hypothetical protein ACIP5U_34265 [Streptomyces sp. NPDC088788]|uniref:hypothetical protein n=1 Tax=Streptomyces sp. NPDC088788 TaxID=3365898 RepID=UPI003808DF6A